MFGKFKKKKEEDGNIEQPKKKQAVKNWYQDRYEFVKLQRNILGLITLLALVATSASVFAVAKLTESKTFEPYVIEIEKRTGITTVVDTKSVQKFTADEIIKKYFLVMYVMAREGFDLADYQYKYTKVVRLMSSTPVFQEFATGIVLENPNSPLNLPRGTKKLVKIKSMTYLDKTAKRVQIRITIDTVAPGGLLTGRDDRIVTMDFDFLEADQLSLSEEDRYINPLNFQVKSYRNDKEVLEKETLTR